MPSPTAKNGGFIDVSYLGQKPRNWTLSGFKFSAVRSLENKSQVRRKYLQITYMRKNLHLEYIRKIQNSIRKKKKTDKNFECFTKEDMWMASKRLVNKQTFVHSSSDIHLSKKRNELSLLHATT